MKSIRTKLRSQKGETLVELLASILVASLSVGLLLGGVAASTNINKKAQRMDEDFYEALTKAESRQNLVTEGHTSHFSVKVAEGSKTVEIPVDVYGEQGLYAYALKPVGGDVP